MWKPQLQIRLRSSPESNLPGRCLTLRSCTYRISVIVAKTLSPQLAAEYPRLASPFYSLPRKNTLIRNALSPFTSTRHHRMFTYTTNGRGWELRLPYSLWQSGTSIFPTRKKNPSSIFQLRKCPILKDRRSLVSHWYTTSQNSFHLL